MKTNDPRERILLIAGFSLLAVGLLIHLGRAPLFLEEPRRALVALEMLRDGHLLVPTIYGELYYNKPPLFNWLLLVFGAPFGFAEWALRLPTVLSLMALAGLMYRLGSRYVDAGFGLLSAVLLVCSVDILFYFSLLAEIDLFYALLSFTGMSAVFHYYQREKPYHLFAAAYLLGAAGFLTKGLPSILFTGFTIVAYLGYRRAWLYLFSPAHALGILLFGLVLGGYFLAYAQYADPWPFIANLWRESSERVAQANKGARLALHLLTFPLDTLKNVLPASVLLLFALAGKNAWRRPLGWELLVFALIALAANYWVYWVSPGARQRYIYPLFPCFVFYFCGLYWAHRDFMGGRRALAAIALALAGALGLGLICYSFFPGEAPLGRRVLLFALGLGGLGVCAQQWRRPALGLATIVIALALARIAFSLIVPPARAADSQAQRDRDAAHWIARTTEGAPLHIAPGTEIPYAIGYYLSLYRGATLRVARDDDDDGPSDMGFRLFDTPPAAEDLWRVARVIESEETVLYLAEWGF